MKELEKLPADKRNFVEYAWRIDSENGNPPTPLTELLTLIAGGGNPYHDERGRFTTGEGESSKSESEPVANFGFEGGWDADRRDVILNTVAKLRDFYPVETYAKLSVNGGRKNNVALEVQALAAVDEHIPTHIDINPNMNSQKWLKKSDPGTSVSTANLADVVTHEFGHVIEGAMPFKFQHQLAAPFLEAQEDYFARQDGDKSAGGKFKDLIHQVSKYAGDNVSEGIAEAFLQYTKGIHNPYSDHVGNVIKEWKEATKK